MKPCDHLKAYLDGELLLWQTWAMRRHVARCPRCQQARAAYDQIKTLLSNQSALEPPDTVLSKWWAGTPYAVKESIPPRRGVFAAFGRAFPTMTSRLVLTTCLLLASCLGMLGTKMWGLAHAANALKKPNSVHVVGRVWKDGKMRKEELWIRGANHEWLPYYVGYRGNLAHAIRQTLGAGIYSHRSCAVPLFSAHVSCQSCHVPLTAQPLKRTEEHVIEDNRDIIVFEEAIPAMSASACNIVYFSSGQPKRTFVEAPVNMVYVLQPKHTVKVTWKVTPRNVLMEGINQPQKKWRFEVDADSKRLIKLQEFQRVGQGDQGRASSSGEVGGAAPGNLTGIMTGGCDHDGWNDINGWIDILLNKSSDVWRLVRSWDKIEYDVPIPADALKAVQHADTEFLIRTVGE